MNTLKFFFCSLVFFSFGLNAQYLLPPGMNLNTPSFSGGGGTPPSPEAVSLLRTFQSSKQAFGYSVADAGDLNGDGYNDILIGAYGTSPEPGYAYIYFGGPSVKLIPDLILTGEFETDGFGISVSSAGDMNADGYDDIVVGAYDYGLKQGAAYVYLGGAVMDNIADKKFEGQSDYSYFGLTVASAGDFNGDGYDDIVIGSYFGDYGISQAGNAMIILGAATLHSTFDAILYGEAYDDRFGYSVAGAGDVNGDGYSDIIIGAPIHDGGAGQTGAAYLYYGGSSINTVYDKKYLGNAAYDQFGFSVAGAGDVNGDGYSDVISGAPLNDYSALYAGAAYVYFGGVSPDVTPDFNFYGTNSNDYFGYRVSGGCDINGDGYDDFLIAAPLNDATEIDAGRVYLFYGGVMLDNIPDNIFSGAGSYYYLGYGISFLKNVDGTGNNEILISSYSFKKVYLYTNKISGPDIPDLIFTGAAAGDYFGNSVASAGDVNGDGYNDFIVGAISNDAGGSEAGRAYLYLGGSNLAFSNVIYLTGTTGNYLGYSVASAGDVNGDGYDDVIVGAPYDHTLGTATGYAHIYFGGAVMDGTPDLTLWGAYANAAFGASVASAGDVNGDGFDDVIVGAFENDVSFTDAGAAYLYYGGNPMNAVYDQAFLGETAADNFGVSVAPAGDVNGDGYADILIGAIYYDYNMMANSGRAYLYYGSSSIDATPDCYFNGSTAGDYFGFSVASAGDMNGDGYSDIVIGAYANDESSDNAGKAYIYYGGYLMDNISDVSMTGEAATDYLGWSVAPAGDVNGDGFDDVLIGAQYNQAGGYRAGRVYLLFGGKEKDTAPDIVMTGPQTDLLFGCSVASAGDLNNDGLTDLIIGARIFSTNKGRVYLFLSSAPAVVPRIFSIEDIPLDQGGAVRVRWTRSGYDSEGENRIEKYVLQRSNPPGAKGFVWDYITEIPATRETGYSHITTTLSDSSVSSTATYYFRVVARGTNNDEVWYSSPVSGHSVDNLPPAAVQNFAGNVVAGNVQMTWKKNTERDLYGYYIYRGAGPVIDPEVTLPLAVIQTTTYTDNSVPPEGAYYFIRAKDVNGNFSSLTSLPGNPLPVELSSFSGKVSGGRVHLTWITTGETDVYGFSVEVCKGEEALWETTGFVGGSGNSNSPKEYSFTDNISTTGEIKYRLKIINNSGLFEYSPEIEVAVGLPDEFALSQNYPNPFNPVTTIEYRLPERSEVRMIIYDASGVEVSRLLQEVQEPGYYTLKFNADRFSSGVYFLRLEAGKFTSVKKMVLIR